MDNFGIGDIIGPAVKLAFKHKILWIFAMFLVAGSSNASSNFNNFSNLSNPSDTDYENNEQFDTEPFDIDEITYVVKESVLGVATDTISPLTRPPELPDFAEFIQKYSLNIFTVITSFTAAMVFMVVLGLIVRNWALGSMLGGTLEGASDRKYSLFQLSTYGRSSVKELIKYSIFIMVLTLLPMIVIFIPTIVAAVTEATALILLSVLLMIPVMFYVLYLSLIGAFATRFIVFKKLGYREAFKQGRVLLHSNFWMSVGLGIINSILGGVLGFAIIIIFMIIIVIIGIPAVAIATASEFDPTAIAMIAIPAFILLMVIGLAATLSKAFVTTYKKFAWTILFNQASVASVPKEVTTSLVGGENE